MSLTSLNRRSDGKDSIVCFLERLATSTADKMPDTGEQHIPFFKKDDVYDLFVQEYAKLHISSPPSKSYFSSIWKSHCNKIKVRKASRFTKCSTCEELPQAIQLAATEGTNTEQLMRERRKHYEMVSRERMEYRKKKELASLHPSNYCSVIIDGADQSAFGLPHFAVNTKDVSCLLYTSDAADD